MASECHRLSRATLSLAILSTLESPGASGPSGCAPLPVAVPVLAVAAVPNAVPPPAPPWPMTAKPT